MIQQASRREKKHKPRPPQIPPLEDTNPDYQLIHGGVIDAFDREGHKEVERRVAYMYRNRETDKHRVFFVGDGPGITDFHHNIFGDDYEALIERFAVFDQWKNRKTGAVIQEVEAAKYLFESKLFTQQLIDEVEKSEATGSPITAIVTLWQDGHDRYLKMFTNALPWVDVYNICHFDSTGQGRSFVRRWRTGSGLFETKSELECDADLQWLIEGIAHEGEVTWFLALPKQMKTWVMLCVVKALLTGEPLFGDERLKVPRKSKKVVYLIPETSRKPFFKRLKTLRLADEIHDPITNPDGRLFVRTLSAGEKIKLTDPQLLDMAKDADIFLDTAIRWLEGEENKSSDVAVLSENIFNLIAAGARSVWCAHHAPKGFADASTMTLENMARGSGEYGAALTNAYGLLQEEEKTSTLRFHAIVGRDLDELIPDMILQGRPYLNETGNFKVVNTNAEPFKGKGGKAGAPVDPERQKKIDFAETVQGSMQEKADAVNKQFGTAHSKGTIHRWLKDQKEMMDFRGGASNE